MLSTGSFRPATKTLITKLGKVSMDMTDPMIERLADRSSGAFS